MPGRASTDFSDLVPRIRPHYLRERKKPPNSANFRYRPRVEPAVTIRVCSGPEGARLILRPPVHVNAASAPAVLRLQAGGQVANDAIAIEYLAYRTVWLAPFLDRGNELAVLKLDAVV